MSISLVLLPVALAMRLVMGKDNFANWVSSMQVKFPTKFNNEADLITTVRKAGYDAEKWGGSIKTHIRDEKEFFFWDFIDGQWVAVFSKHDSMDSIKKFIIDLESKAGRSIFVVNDESKKITTIPTRTFPTNFKDAELLVQTLKDHGINPTVYSNDEIKYDFGEYTLRFFRQYAAPFNMEIESIHDMKSIFQHISLLDRDYKEYVQTITYKNLKSYINEKNMTIESEEILEDNTVVLTLLIN
jgi:hypothetical protein